MPRGLPKNILEVEVKAATKRLGIPPANLVIYKYEVRKLNYIRQEILEELVKMKKEIAPDLVFIPSPNDLHQDHRLVNELTWNTWRNHMILEYEIPKYDGDLGQPNVFVAISPEQVERKIKTVLEVFGSQTSKDWFDADTLSAILRLRGVESNAPQRYAEAFYTRKLRLEF